MKRPKKHKNFIKLEDKRESAEFDVYAGET